MPCDQVRRQRSTEPQRDIDAFFAWVDEAVVEDQFKLDVGVQAQELHRHGIEMPLPERDGGAYTQQALRLQNLLARISHRIAVVLQEPAGALMETLSLLRQAQAGGRAAQKTHAQRAFQTGDQLADAG